MIPIAREPLAYARGNNRAGGHCERWRQRRRRWRRCGLRFLLCRREGGRIAVLLVWALLVRWICRLARGRRLIRRRGWRSLILRSAHGQNGSRKRQQENAQSFHAHGLPPKCAVVTARAPYLNDGIWRASSCPRRTRWCAKVHEVCGALQSEAAFDSSRREAAKRRGSRHCSAGLSAAGSRTALPLHSVYGKSLIEQTNGSLVSDRGVLWQVRQIQRVSSLSPVTCSVEKKVE